VVYLRVSFMGRLVAGNRVTVPVEIRWKFRLEPGEIYLVRLEFEEWGSAEFYARLQRGGQVTVPVEVVRAAGLERDEVMEVFVHVSEE
jgi:bifunctional DNA-binding transcriptional regulator/antitoxin component of YhaV-PrlF toxin-antitoxin module